MLETSKPLRKPVEKPVDLKDIEYDYSKELLEDDILQQILEMVETKHTLELHDFKNIYSKKDIDYSLIFLESKIEYLENLQDSFHLRNNALRLTEIAKILDSITVEKYYVNVFNEFSTKASMLLDIMYLAKNSIYNTYEIEVKNV